ncbi:MAG: hypothetical protein H7A17_03470 [Sinobacteraceae bacterium]|nr:hypothetical protein [Nevskiaceae bacterium]MCP5338653.1 hypothetical protein [Nevskiaceae bacterium]MCP5466668.1 hypothetical protein [Nevskiaceae bacterium]
MNCNWRHVLPGALVAVSLAIGGCANREAPAVRAVADAKAALATFRDQAEQFAASELQQVDAVLGDLEAHLQNGDYGAMVDAAPDLSMQIEALYATTVERRAAHAQANIAARVAWTTLAEDVPKMIQALQSRIDVLAKSRRLPADLDRTQFDAVRVRFEQMKSLWLEATAAVAAGEVVEAVGHGEMAATKGAEAMSMLGMTIDTAGG